MDVFCVVQQTVKLTAPTKKTQLQTPLAYNNSLAHAMRVKVMNDNGTDADLTGVSVTARMLRADNETVYPIIGTTNGSTAEVLLPASCYVVPGRFKFTMNLNSSEPYSTEGIDDFSTSVSYAVGDLCVRNGTVYRFINTHQGGWSDEDAVVATHDTFRTIMWVEGYVERNTTETIVDPGGSPGNIDEIIDNASAAASEAWAAAASVPGVKNAIAPDYEDIDFPIGAYVQHCWYGGHYYVCTVDINQAEAFNPAHWEETDVDTSLADLWYDKTSQTMVAPDYSGMQAYQRGAVVWHEGELYEAIDDVILEDPFVPSHWRKTTVQKQITGVSNTVDYRANILMSTIAPIFAYNVSYSAGDYVYFNNLLYRFTANHTGTWTMADVEAVTLTNMIDTATVSETLTYLGIT